jgi:pimeloyl-ACP methyl ester carboxylesterase
MKENIMHLIVARFRACLIFCLLLLTALPAFAFDEDHHEVINGAMLHFRVRGTDKAHPYLVLLHGGPGFSAHMFYPWGASLEKTLNVVYLDQRGSGESARLTVRAQPGTITKTFL